MESGEGEKARDGERTPTIFLRITYV